MPKNCAVILTKSTSVWLHLPAPPAHRVYRTIEDQRGIALPISIRSCWSARCKTTSSGSMPEITALPIPAPSRSTTVLPLGRTHHDSMVPASFAIPVNRHLS